MRSIYVVRMARKEFDWFFGSSIGKNHSNANRAYYQCCNGDLVLVHGSLPPLGAQEAHAKPKLR